jgi:hypothetical protein
MNSFRKKLRDARVGGELTVIWDGDEKVADGRHT